MVVSRRLSEDVIGRCMTIQVFVGRIFRWPQRDGGATPLTAAPAAFSMFPMGALRLSLVFLAKIPVADPEPHLGRDLRLKKPGSI